MSKQILVLAGSPRKKGNSDMLCEQFTAGAKSVGHEVEKIYVSEQKIGYCKACYFCEKTSKCVQDDDMAEIIEKLVNADVIVLATPTYFYSMSAQLKTLIDRTLPTYYAEQKISDKEFYFIVTAAEEKEYIKRVVDSLYGFTDCLPNPNIKAVICGECVLSAGEIKDGKAMQEAYDAGVRV